MATSVRRSWAFASVVCTAALVSACGSEDDSSSNPTDVRAEVSEHVNTVINVHWKTEKPSTGYVEYGPTEALGLSTPMTTEKMTEHTQPLVGLKQDTVYHYRVVTWDGDAGQSGIQSAPATGFLPSGLPQLELQGSGHDEFIIVPLLGILQSVLIIDPDGEIVWYHSDEDAPEELDYYRARLSRDGKGLLYNAAKLSGGPSEESAIVRISFDGSEREEIRIPLLAHDFVEHTDGTIAALVSEDRESEDGTIVRGNRVVEVDPDGNEEEVWNSWNCFDPVEHPGDDPEVGWTFANALDYNEAEDVYYVGLRNFSSITQVNRAGDCEWVFGFTASTIEFDPNARGFQHQHQFQVFSDEASCAGCKRLLMMDNDGPLAEESRVVEFLLDFDANLGTQMWSYTSTPSVYTYVLGEPHRYPNGDTFINWSAAGMMERINANNETTWKLEANLGAAFGFNTLAKNLYEP